MAYLDDIVVLSNDASTLVKIKNFFANDLSVESAGLRLNHSKSKIISLGQVKEKGLELMGGFIGEAREQEQWLVGRTEKTRRKLDSLKQCNIQDAFLLLQQSIHPEVRHLPRYCRSSSASAGYKVYDDHLASTVRHLRRSAAALPTDEAIQSLPLREGGLGLPPLTMLCAPALASCSIAYHEKAEDWLGLDLEKDVDRESLDRDKSQPVQKQLTNRAARDAFYDIADGLAAEELVAIEEGATKLGHLWLRALPYTKQLEMSDASFSSSLAIRTLVKETAPNCSSCGQEQRYRHPESCPHTNKLQTLRHDRVKGILYRAMRRTPGRQCISSARPETLATRTARISPSRVTCRRTGPGWILTSPSWDQPRPPSTPSSAPIGAESIQSPRASEDTVEQLPTRSRRTSGQNRRAR